MLLTSSPPVTVTLLKKNGKKYDKIEASVQKGKIFINRSDILIESGDLIQRKMSNGGEETYKVIDPGFHEQSHQIPAGYDIDVIKLGLSQAEKAIQSITFNISGSNARINQNSIDNSYNIVNSNSDLLDQLQALKDEISKLKLETSEVEEALEIINAIDSQIKSQSPQKTVVKTLLKGLPNAGSIASIGGLILSLLG